MALLRRLLLIAALMAMKQPRCSCSLPSAFVSKARAQVDAIMADLEEAKRFGSAMHNWARKRRSLSRDDGDAGDEPPKGVWVRGLVVDGGYTAEQLSQFCSDIKPLIRDLYNNAGGPGRQEPVAGCGWDTVVNGLIMSSQGNYSKFCSSAEGSPCGTTSLYASASSIVTQFQGKIDGSKCRIDFSDASNGTATALGNAYDPSDILRVCNYIVGPICSKINSQYCWTEFPQFTLMKTIVLGSQPSDASGTVMASGCSQCNIQVFRDLMVLGGGHDEMESETLLMQVLCYRPSGGTWCGRDMLLIQGPVTASYKGMDVANIICNELCAKPVLTMMQDYLAREDGQNVDTMLRLMMDEVACVTNTQTSKLCVESMGFSGDTPADYAALVGDCGAPLKGPDASTFPSTFTCSLDLCAPKLQAVADNWGCCANFLLEHPEMPSGFKRYFDQMQSACLVTFPDACTLPRTFDLGFCLVTDNLLYTYYEQNQQLLDRNLCLEMSKMLGAPTTKCVVLSRLLGQGVTAATTATSTSTTLCLQLRYPFKATAEAAKSIMDAYKPPPSPPRAVKTFSNLPSRAKINPLLGVLVTSFNVTLEASDAGRNAGIVVTTPPPFSGARGGGEAACLGLSAAMSIFLVGCLSLLLQP